MKQLLPSTQSSGVRLLVAMLALLVSGTIVTASPAFADITPSGAADIANAVARDPSQVTGASFVSVPPAGNPDAVSTTPLTSFPTDGQDYGILTSGDATLADDPNDSGSSGADDGGGNVRGNTDFDVTILKIDLSVPEGQNCLGLDFQFLSEEFPEFVGSQFNDAFIAELDVSDWSTSGSVITAPHNFAFDPDGNVISINSTGVAQMSAENAAGTTYDGATTLLSAQTPVTPGPHSLYLSIFDQSDHSYDSAAFVDNVRLGQSGEGGCQPGAQQPADVSIDKADSADPVVVGDTFTYTLTAQNAGPGEATNVTIEDSLPQEVGFVSAQTSQGTCSEEGGVVTCSLGTLSVDGQATVAIDVTANQVGTVSNTGSVSAAEPDPVPENNSDTESTTINPLTSETADLSIDKSDAPPYGPDPVSSGQLVAYGISVTNNGPDAATGISVTDTPTTPDTTVQSGSGTNWSCQLDSESNTLTCTYGATLGAEETAEPLTVVVRAPTNPGSANIIMTDQASVSADQVDPNTENNTDSEDTTVRGSGSDFSKDHAKGFFDNVHTLKIATKRDQTGGFYSSVTIPPDPGLQPGVVSIDEFPATQPPYNTLCGGKPCDAQVQVSGLPVGQAAANNPMRIHWFFPEKDISLLSTQASRVRPRVWVKGDNEPIGTVLKRCITRGIANPPKCVNSIRVLRIKVLDIMLLWRDGGDPWGGKR